MRVQALYGDLPEDTKIAAEVKSRKALLKLAGAEPALQLAQLVALEHLLGVTLPARTKEVRSLLCRPALSCASAAGIMEALWVLRGLRGRKIPADDWDPGDPLAQLTWLNGLMNSGRDRDHGL